MQVANPIYDTVFKYLMEDERVARTILSALLKKDVLNVQTRRNEYTNQERDSISMFRIDFAATIRNENGEESLILIELQKTWLETETLRFRQYLGVQYSNAENMVAGQYREYALPMVAVYLLGHKVGNIEEPVLYVCHAPYNYDGQLVTKGMPDPFVDSLTHDSIIVQIPRLHGKVNNHLDKVLSIFDQSLKDVNDKHVLNIDEALYAGDSDMQPILHRLVVAAADSQMRHKMNVEDEFFSAIERRDTDLLIKDKLIAEKTVLLAEKDGQLAEKDGQLADQRKRLEHQDTIIRKSVLALLRSGLSTEQIADMLSIDIGTVRKLM